MGKSMKNNDNQFLKNNGIFYTNEFLAKKMVKLLKIDYSKNFTLLEPAVGEGHILKIVVQQFLENNISKSKFQVKKSLEQNFCAFDIREEAVEKCIENLDNLVSNYYMELNINWNIFTFNALNKQELKEKIGKFDYIISNPPYISRKNMNDEVVKKLRKVSSFCNKFNFDIYYYFFELGIELWNKKGKMVYITPNSYLKARSAEVMLHSFIDNQLLESIVDFEDLLKFEDATTYTAISVFSVNNDLIYLYKDNELLVDKIEYEALNHKQQVYIYDKEFEVSDINDYIELGEVADIKNGLATLNDKVFIIKENEVLNETATTITIRKSEKDYMIEKSGLRVVKRASEIQKTNYVIFPYNSNNLRIEDLKQKLPRIYNYLTNVINAEYKKKYKLYFGRTQGMRNYSNTKIIIPKVAHLDESVFKTIDCGFVLSGLSIVFNQEISQNSIKEIVNYLNSKVVLDYLSLVSKNYAAGYKSISSTDLKKIKVPKQILKS